MTQEARAFSALRQLVAAASIGLASACNAAAPAPSQPSQPARSLRTFPCAEKARATGTPDAAEMFEGAARGGPQSRGLVAANGRVYSRTSPPFEIDADGAKATALPLPDGLEVLDLAIHAGSVWAVARTKDGGVHVFERTASGWREQPLSEPIRVASEATPVAFTGSDALLVLLVGSRLAKFADGSWSLRSVRAPAGEGGRFRALLTGRTLYVGRDGGEWGGELASIDVDRGDWHPEPMGEADSGELTMPVHDLALDRNGVPWAVRGLAHIVGVDGALYRRDPSGWSLVASASGVEVPSPSPPGKCAGDWNLPQTSFAAMAFDAEGRVLLSTGTLGLVRRSEAGGWTRLTPAWSSFAYLEGLTVAGSKVVIGSFDAGIAIWRPDAALMRHLQLGEPRARR